MHDTAYALGRQFFASYWQAAFTDVVELGSLNVNGSLRDHCPEGARYLGLDGTDGPGVDRVVAWDQPLPLADGCTDVVLSSSALEHDPFFWQSFLEMLRLLRPGGLLYINAPSNHDFHRHPVDCWRFYPDAGHALVRWAHRHGLAVQLVESFVAAPQTHGWSDFVAVFRVEGTVPLQRRGRLADALETHNGYDIDAQQGLLRESQATYDSQERQRLQARLEGARAELDKANQAILVLKEELRALRSRAQAPPS
ncbi:MAG: methyltransferase domain-containing protein [Proteobacteria bacterium]|nr:methyltransferase domain-containing protein [Pseudomonadota bacterium]